MDLTKQYLLIVIAAIGVATLSPALAVAGPTAPAKEAIPSEQPTKPWPSLVRDLVCTATGTYTDEDGSGPGAFTRTAKPGCHAHGVWTDTFGYTWRLEKSGGGHLVGSVHYHGIPGCKANVWPVTGKYHEAQFTVTATNPVSNDSCSPFFTYSLTIQ